jgi:hypothetical protein
MARFFLQLRAIVPAFAVLTVCSVASAEPSAADRETARDLMKEGDKKSAAKDWAGAMRAYEEAHKLVNVPSTGRELARAQESLGLFVEARDTCSLVTKMPQTPGEPTAFTTARTECADVAQALAPKIGTLRIVIEGVSAELKPEITIDGVPIPGGTNVSRRVNPGRHMVKAAAPGYGESRAETTLSEGGMLDVKLTLTPDGKAPKGPVGPVGPSTGPGDGSPVPPEPVMVKKTSPLVYVGFGLAGVGVVAGGITGALAFSKSSAAKDKCTDNLCPSSAQSDIDSSKTMGTISTIGFGVGIVGAAVGVAGLFLSKSVPQSSTAKIEPPPRRLVPLLGPTGAGLMGTF